MPLLPASQVVDERVAYLWPGRLPLDYLTILDGDPSLGKSLITLDLCARLSTGRPFPDGAPSPGPATSIILNAEDGAADVLCPRLRAMGADLSRILVWRPQPGEPLLLPAHAHVIHDALEEYHAALVVVDPLFAFLDPRVMAASDQHVRQALAPLADLARGYHCNFLMVRHPNKSRLANALYRGSYSIGFSALCRSTWLVGRHPEEPKRAVLAQVKNNLDPPQKSLAYAIVARNGQPALDWLGPCTWTADDLLRSNRAAPVLRRAADLLTNLLKDGPKAYRELARAARLQGVSTRTLDRARRLLKIDTVRTGPFTHCQTTYWVAEGQEIPRHLKNPNDIDLEPWFQALRQKCAPHEPEASAKDPTDGTPHHPEASAREPSRDPDTDP
jgi:hypothetical protein